MSLPAGWPPTITLMAAQSPTQASAGITYIPQQNVPQPTDGYFGSLQLGAIGISIALVPAATANDLFSAVPIGGADWYLIGEYSSGVRNAPLSAIVQGYSVSGGTLTLDASAGGNQFVDPNNQFNGYSFPATISFSFPYVPPQPQPPLDFFTPIAIGILKALRAYSGFTNLVKAQNLIDMTTSAFANTSFKNVVGASDAPEIILLQDTLKIHRANSMTFDFKHRMYFVCTYDNLRTRDINQVKTAILIGLIRAGPELGIPPLPGLNCKWIRGWEPLDASDKLSGESDTKQWMRGSVRWIGFMGIEVTTFHDIKTLGNLS
jgi:hypothetical protein